MDSDPRQEGQDREGREDGRPGHRPAQVPERMRFKGMNAAYQGAMEAVLSIVIAILIGWWIDGAFETGPWGVLAGATIGFGAFVLRLSRLRATLDLPEEDPASPPGGSEQRGGAPAARDASPLEQQDGTKTE